MSVADAREAQRAAILADYPLTASHDEEGALRHALARLLAEEAEVRVPGRPVARAVVSESEPAQQVLPGDVEILPEWADGEQVMRLPHAVLQDAIGRYEPIQGGTIDESTIWPSSGDARAALHVTDEFVVEIPVWIFASDRPTRMAIVRAFRAVLRGSTRATFEGTSDGRHGRVVDTGALYYGRIARFELLSGQRADTADAAAMRRRIAILTVRASILVAEPVVFAPLSVVGFDGPLEQETAGGVLIGLDL